MSVSSSLNLYAEGDPEFKKEIAVMLLQNILELRESLIESVDKANAEIYRSVCHKMRAPLDMLGDEGFSKLAEEIRIKLQATPKPDGELSEKIKSFMNMTERFIAELNEALKTD